MVANNPNFPPTPPNPNKKALGSPNPLTGNYPPPPPEPPDCSPPAPTLCIGLTKIGTKALAFRVLKQSNSLTNKEYSYPHMLEYVASNGVVIRSEQIPSIRLVAPDTSGHSILIVNIRGEESTYDQIDSSVNFNSTEQRDASMDRIVNAFSEFKSVGFKYSTTTPIPVEAVFSF